MPPKKESSIFVLSKRNKHYVRVRIRSEQYDGPLRLSKHAANKDSIAIKAAPRNEQANVLESLRVEADARPLMREPTKFDGAWAAVCWRGENPENERWSAGIIEGGTVMVQKLQPM